MGGQLLGPRAAVRGQDTAALAPGALHKQQKPRAQEFCIVPWASGSGLWQARLSGARGAVCFDPSAWVFSRSKVYVKRWWKRKAGSRCPTSCALA